MNKKVNHNNVFESYIAQDILILDILEKIANDWKEAGREDFDRETFEEFIIDDFTHWLECGLQDFLDAEFGEVE